MRLRTATGVCVASAVVALSPTMALSAAGDPQQKHTAAGTLQATSALVRTADLGAGWKGASRSNGGLPCDVVLLPNESDLIEVGKADGPLFTRGAEAVAQNVHVFATEAQATAAWKRTVTEKLVLCMEQQVENASSMGAPVSVTEWRRLALPRLAGRVKGFRVVAKAKTGKKMWSKAYFDQLLLSHGKTMTGIIFSSLRAPVAKVFEQKVVRIVSDRVAAG